MNIYGDRKVLLRKIFMRVGINGELYQDCTNVLLVWPHAWACLLGYVCSPQSRGEQQCTLAASIAWPGLECRNFNEPSLLEDRCHLASTGTCKGHTSRAGVLLFQALQVQRMLVRVELQVCYSWTIALRQRLPTSASVQPSSS